VLNWNIFTFAKGQAAPLEILKRVADIGATVSSQTASIAMDDPRNVSQLRILQRQYFQLVEPHDLRWPDDAILKAPEVQSWLFKNLFDTANIISPPPDRYQLRTLKQLVAKLERSITDPEEDVWSPVSSLLLCFHCSSATYHVAIAFFQWQRYVPACADPSLRPVCRKFQMILWKR
jgi:hypothetical protein